MDNAERAGYGANAVIAGSPDAGKNDDGYIGALTDAGDAIANILHWLYVQSGYDTAATLVVVETAEMHFTAEIRGDL